MVIHLLYLNASCWVQGHIYLYRMNFAIVLDSFEQTAPPLIGGIWQNWAGEVYVVTPNSSQQCDSGGVVSGGSPLANAHPQSCKGHAHS